MSTEVGVRDQAVPRRIEAAPSQRHTLPELMQLGAVLAKSGYFADARAEAQAVVKVLAGAELGISPIAAMTGIHIVKGKVTLGANLIAAQIRRHPRYDYRFAQELSNEVCAIEFLDVSGPEPVVIGSSRFTMEDAKKAGLVRGDSPWVGHARNMLFARAMSNGAKWYCPDVFTAAVYTPDEMGAVVDYETGEVIEMPTESAPSAPGGAVAAPPARGRTGAAPAPGPQRSSSPSGSAGVAGSAMEVSHPEHRLHELWRILDALGIEWKPANYMRAIEVLKREGIENVDALRDDITHARAKALVRIAFGVKLEPEGEPAEAVLNPPDFPAPANDHPAEGLHAKSFTNEVDGTVTAMYAMPSSKDPEHRYGTHLSNGGRHVCDCPARKVPCRHVTEALGLLREDAERDAWVMRRFAVLLGLEEPAEDGEPAPETTGDAA